MVMAASERFTKLGEQMDRAQDNIEAAAHQDEAELGVKVAEARKRADDQAAQMQANAQKSSEQAKDHWHKVQSDWDQHIQRIRADLNERKAEHDAKHAEREAEDAEADAVDAIDFAAAAIQEAEYAVLDAALARMNADALAVSSS
jgi:hypothetical protein